MTKIDRAALRQKIQQLEGLSDDERAALLELVATKRYGLVWEEREEEVEERLREELPVLVEDKELALTDGGKDAPNHILIEGDNLEALTTLSYTHEGKVDVIYIDPPYNTGAQNWRYNNDFVDAEDGYRHSKWLSWMNKRLKIAKRLLCSTGNIIVTIDDYEYATLKLLMDEIFGEENYLATVVIRNNPSGRSTVRGFSINHEYALFYSKSEFSQLGRLSHSEGQKSRYLENDNVGQFEWENFRKNGTDSDRKDRPKQFYPIVLKTKTGELSIPNIEWDDKEKSYFFDNNTKEGEIILLPISPEGNEKVWKFGLERTKTILGEILVKKKSGKYELYRKKYLNTEGSLPHTWWDKPDYSARDNGTRTLTNIFGPQKVFDFPKAPEAVKDALISANLKKDGIVLDFFAGSGTTLHAVMQLNKEDGGKRQCILVTNNENNICRDVTYERNKRVIEGYTTPKGVQVEGLPENNLRYYRTHLLPRERTNRNMRRLVAASTDLLCIKENIFDEFQVSGFKFQARDARLFSDGERAMMVIYNEDAIPEVVEWLSHPANTSLDVLAARTRKIKVYVFSPGAYAWDDDFAEVIDKVELCALPEAIYQAYKSVLPKKKARRETAEGSPKEGGEE
jgi:adenine-specific DNA-methyltransferase